VRPDDDLKRELADHLDLDAEDRRRDGASPKEARLAARRELGNLTRIQETVYDMHPLAHLDRAWKDVRFAARSLGRKPGFTVVAVLALALGIGAAGAVFTVADQALLQLLPVQRPSELRVFNWSGSFIGGSTQGYAASFSYPAFLDFAEERPQSVSGLAARFQARVALDAGSGVDRGVVEIVSGDYFRVLGIEAELGRALLPEDDDEKDAEPWMVLTHEYWRDHFGADPDVLGQTVRLNGFPMTVVGVAQPGFRGFEKLSPADAFITFQMNGVAIPTYDLRHRRNAIWLNIFTRLAPGAAPQRALADLQSVYEGILRRDLEAHPRSEEKAARVAANKLEFAEAGQGLEVIQNAVSSPIHILGGMAGLLLLITCVSVANLLMIRAAQREKEIALRSSLGATRAAVARLVLVESLMLAFAGSAFGLLFARIGAEGLVRMIPVEQLGIALNTTVDARVVGFSVALAFLTALIFGSTPAIQTVRAANAETLKNEAASVSLGRSQTRVRRTLIVAQVALSLTLVAVAGLFGKSLGVLFERDPGFDVDRLLAFSANPSEHRYTPERTHRFAVDLQRRLAQLPGVESVSASATPLLSGANGQNTIAAEGYEPSEGEDMQAGHNYVLPGFFATTGIGLLAGREFTGRDVLDAPEVVIVNQAFADRFFGSPAQAIGRRTGFGLGKVLPFEVVGVVADHAGKDLAEEDFPRTYWPLLQKDNPDHIAFYLRARGEPENLISSAAGAVRELDSELAVFRVTTVERSLERTHFIELLFARLSATFAVLATLIALVGLYGVTAFSVARRTREIGVRLALGAQRHEVFGMVVREALALAAIGVALGLPLAFALGKAVEAQLFGVPAIDPVVSAAAVFALLTAAALAGYAPARRAMRTSPVQALRHE